MNPGRWPGRSKNRSERFGTLVGLDELVELLIDYYEQMDTEAKRLVPLRRVYWPVG